MSITVSTYRYPFGSVAPGLYKSIAIALNGSGANIGESGIESFAAYDFARAHAMHALMYLATNARKFLKWYRCLSARTVFPGFG